MSNQIESNPIVSVTFVANPIDSRCRFWAKYIPATKDLPPPSTVSGAGSLPGDYIRRGDDVEIMPGDYVMVGEERHHRKMHGWDYKLYACKSDGRLISVDYTKGGEVKKAIRAAGRADLLAGSGDIAAMVRYVLARRASII